MVIALDLGGNAYVAGFTDSANFPTTAGAFDTSFNGGPSDAFVTKLDLLPLGPPTTVTLAPPAATNTVGTQHCVTQRSRTLPVTPFRT